MLKVGGKIQKENSAAEVDLHSPEQAGCGLRCRVQVRITSDGTTMTTAVMPLKRYTTAPAPKAIGIEAFREGPIGAMIFGGPAGAPMFVLLNLLTSADPAAAIAQFGGTLQVAPARVVDAKVADAAGSRPEAANPSFTIEFDKGQTDFVVNVDNASSLISSIDMKVDPAKFSRALPNGQEIKIEQFGWKSGAIATELPKDHTFVYEAPKGFSKVDSLTERDGQKDHRLLGKPAPEFTPDGARRAWQDQDHHQGRTGR